MIKKIKLNRWLKLALKISFSAVALYFVFLKIEFSSVIAVFKQSNFVILLAALFFFSFSKFISSLRLHLIFRNEDIPITQKSNIKLYLIGMYYNLLLPGGIGGDGYKVWLLNKKFGNKVKKLIWNVLIDRVSGLVALLSIALVFLFFIIRYEKVPGYLPILSLLSIPTLVLSYYLFFCLFLKNYKRIFLSIFSYSVLVQGSQVVCALLILWAFGCKVNTIDYLFVFLISSIIILLPNFFGGLGARELTFLLGAKILPLDEDISIALSLMFYFISAFVSLFGIFFSIQSDDKIIKEDGSGKQEE